MTELSDSAVMEALKEDTVKNVAEKFKVPPSKINTINARIKRHAKKAAEKKKAARLLKTKAAAAPVAKTTKRESSTVKHLLSLELSKAEEHVAALRKVLKSL